MRMSAVRWVVGLGSVLALHAGVVAWLGARVPGPSLSAAFELGFALLCLAACWEAGRRAAHPGRSLWRLVMASLGMWMVARLMTAFHGASASPGYDVIADLLFASSALPLAAAPFLAGRDARFDRLHILDLIQLALFWAAVYLCFPLPVGDWAGLRGLIYYAVAATSLVLWPAGRSLAYRMLAVLGCAAAAGFCPAVWAGVAWSTAYASLFLLAAAWAPKTQRKGSPWSITEALTVRQLGPLVYPALVLVLATGIIQVRPVLGTMLVLYSFAAACGRFLIATHRTERALQGAIGDAAESARAKDAFLAHVGQEVRAPASGIAGLADLVLDSDLTTSQREQVQIVRELAGRITQTISDALDLSHIESGRLTLEHKDFDLRAVLADALQPLAARAQKKDLELVCRIGTGVPPRLTGDAGRLQQILLNLLGNALRFTERGAAALRVELHGRAGNRVMLHFRVADTGLGIAQDLQARIAETLEHPGMQHHAGLGLPISARLAQLMGGTTWFESEQGKGSAFHFTAVFDVAEGGAPRLDAAMLRGQPVLILDDHPASRQLLEEITAGWWMSPRSFAAAKDLMAAIESACSLGAPVPLLLLGTRMLDHDGFWVVEQMKQMGIARRAVMLLTPENQAAGAVRCRKLGITAHVVKPVFEHELLDNLLSIAGSRNRDTATSRRRVLLAEHDTVHRTPLLRQLEKEGFSVAIAKTGRDAFSLWEHARFDLILLDTQLPDLNGFEVASLIRARETARNQHTQILAMSEQTGDRTRSTDAGMDGCLLKPVRSDALIEEIFRRLEAAPAA